MADDPRRILNQSLRTMIKPLMRFCVRYTLQIKEIIEAVKVGLVDAAEEDLRGRSAEPNVSRISAMTGLHRREVTRIFRQREIVEEPRGLVTRTIGQWRQDRRFSTKPGVPRVLSFDGPKSEFRKLCRAVSADLNPGTMLLELERIGAVQRGNNGIKLITGNYVPKGNMKEGLSMLARDMNDLINAVSGNVFGAPKVPNLHGKTEFDNISPAEEERIRKWLLEEGSAFQQRAAQFLSQFDRDVNPHADKAAGRIRVAVGSFGFVEPKKGK